MGSFFSCATDSATSDSNQQQRCNHPLPPPIPSDYFQPLRNLSSTAHSTRQQRLIESQRHSMPLRCRVNSASLLIELNSDSSEYIQVKNHFCQTTNMPEGHSGRMMLYVKKIERIQNPEVYRRYEAAKQRLLAKNPHHDVDVITYHGCKSSTVTDPVTSIVDNGLDVKHGRALPGYIWSCKYSGYSASSYCSYVAGSEGLRQIFRCKCAPNMIEFVQPVLGVYTINESSRMLPEYLITFSSV